MADRRIRSIIHRIEHATLDALPASESATMIIAVSGGADSAATLVALHQRAHLHAWKLHAAHFDHGIADPQVRESFRNAAKSIADRLDVAFHSGVGDVPAQIAAHGGNLESVARDARYKFLQRLALELDAGAVVKMLRRSFDRDLEELRP